MMENVNKKYKNGRKTLKIPSFLLYISEVFIYNIGIKHFMR